MKTIQFDLQRKRWVVEAHPLLALPPVRREPRDLTDLQIVFWTGLLLLLTVGSGCAVVQYLILPLLKGGKP